MRQILAALSGDFSMDSTKFRHFLIICLSAFLGIYGYAQMKQGTQKAQPASGIQSGGFDCTGLLRQVDRDQDGFITREEWGSYFDSHDENADQRLSFEEIRTNVQNNGLTEEEALGPDYGRLRAFQRLDRNRNDAIDRSEWPGKEKDFRYLDADRNGVLSSEEFLSRNGRFWNEPFENLDFNGDGIITRSEWLDSDASFDRLDRDHNGSIERFEFYNPR
jgi:hypothetical protein